MRSVFSRPSYRRNARCREVFSAQFDGGHSADTYGTSIHLGCDVLERSFVLTASEGDFVFSQGTITGYTGEGGVVDIPSKIGGVPVKVIGNNAFASNPTITSVAIPKSVKRFGDSAFAYNTGLASVTIGSGVKTIGNNAFRNASSLASVRFAGNAPAVGADAFTGVAPGAKAYRAPKLSGYGPDGSNFYGLIVATPLSTGRRA